VEVVASLSQDRRTAARCGLFTHKSVPVIFEPPCNKAHPPCMLDTQGYKYTHPACVIFIAFPQRQNLHESATVLLHTYMACLVSLERKVMNCVFQIFPQFFFHTSETSDSFTSFIDEVISPRLFRVLQQVNITCYL